MIKQVDSTDFKRQCLPVADLADPSFDPARPPLSGMEYLRLVRFTSMKEPQIYSKGTLKRKGQVKEQRDDVDMEDGELLDDDSDNDPIGDGNDEYRVEIYHKHRKGGMRYINPTINRTPQDQLATALNSPYSIHIYQTLSFLRKSLWMARKGLERTPVFEFPEQNDEKAWLKFVTSPPVPLSRLALDPMVSPPAITPGDPDFQDDSSIPDSQIPWTTTTPTPTPTPSALPEIPTPLLLVLPHSTLITLLSYFQSWFAASPQLLTLYSRKWLFALLLIIPDLLDSSEHYTLREFYKSFLVWVNTQYARALRQSELAVLVEFWRVAVVEIWRQRDLEVGRLFGSGGIENRQVDVEDLGEGEIGMDFLDEDSEVAC